MMKYTQQELKVMADRLIIAREQGDLRYLDFLITLSAVANVSPEAIEQKIQEYADYKESNNV